MEEKQIKVVCNWLELLSVRDIPMFWRFANFYWRFIQGFSGRAAPFISRLKILEEVRDENLEQGDKGI